MKILRKDLYNIADQKVYKVDEKLIVIDNNIYIKRIENVKGDITFYYDESNDLSINYQLDGIMVCPDSFTLEDVEVQFNISDDLKVSDNQEEDGFYFIDGMEICEFVEYIVLPEVPIKVEKSGETMYYSGDGWTICSEEEYNKSAKEKVDPRLEKILEYKEEK